MNYLLSELTRQQLCAALGVSESTVRRLERAGLPFTPVGKRAKRYNLDECKAWLRAYTPSATIRELPTHDLLDKAREFTESCRNVRLRVMPSDD